jgi:hypothetical protein
VHGNHPRLGTTWRANREGVGSWKDLSRLKLESFDVIELFCWDGQWVISRARTQKGGATPQTALLYLEFAHLHTAGGA